MSALFIIAFGTCHPPQEKLSEKEKLIDEQQREIAVLKEELSPLQVRNNTLDSSHLSFLAISINQHVYND